jgi:hypothetical protein
MDRRDGEPRRLKAAAATARALLVVYMVAATLMIVGFALTFNMRSSPMLVMGVLGMIVMITVTVICVSMIAVSAWVFLAHRHLRTNGTPDLRFSPIWAVLSFFIPVINLFVPFQAMRDLYNRSAGEPAHFANQSVSDVSSWWTCFLVGSSIQMFNLGKALVQAATNVIFTAPPVANMILTLFGESLLLGSAFFLHRIIGEIARSQMANAGIYKAFA